MSEKREKITEKEVLLFFLPAVLLTIAGFVVTYQFVSPSPPRVITMATGPEDSAYSNYGSQYKKLMKQNGITLNLKTTVGSLENLRLLEDGSSGVDIAIFQGGIGQRVDSKHILSIGSLYYEPLWIFYQKEHAPVYLSDLKGFKIAIGEAGSGTNVMARELLKLNGIDDRSASLVQAGYSATASMLMNKEVDAAFFVATHRAPYIKHIFSSKSVLLLGIERAEAYALRFHNLNVVKLPKGVLDFGANIPAADINLLASVAQLAVRSDLHPALIDLVLQAAREVHQKGGGLEQEGEFPSPRHLDFELSEEAERFYKNRKSFLQRYLPFWVATFVSRMAIFIVPILTLFFPLVKLMPMIYRWRMRARVYRWYSDLYELDIERHGQETVNSCDESIQKLDQLEKKVAEIVVPRPFAESLFQLRLHIDMLRKKLKQIQNSERKD